MRVRITVCIAAFLALFILVVPAAEATIREDLWTLELVERVDPRSPGEPTRIVLDLVSRSDVPAEVVSVTGGADWNEVAHEMVPFDPEGFRDDHVQHQRFVISGVTGKAASPLQLTVRVDGQEHTERLEIDLPETRVMGVQVADERIIKSPGVTPEGGHYETTWTREAEESSSVAARRTLIRVRGAIAYVRPDGMMVGADRVKVKVHDDEGFYNNGLVEGYTDDVGNFDLTFDWNYGVLIDPEPDLVVSVETHNDQIDVRSDRIVSGNYSVNVWMQNDYTGSPDINLGTIVTSDPTMNGALRVHSNMQRVTRWYATEGFPIGHTLVRWPSGNSEFGALNGIIYVRRGSEWQANEMNHEFGHKFLRTYGDLGSGDPCNGICDSGGCSLCIWCHEDADFIWKEMFPNFLAYASAQWVTANYLEPSTGLDDTETIGTCDTPGGPILDDPLTTYGIFVGFCRDMIDDDQDNDPAFSAMWQDASSISPSAMLQAAAATDPSTPHAYVDALLNHMVVSSAYTDQDIENLWETGQNNGIEFDQFGPGIVQNLTSGTHIAGVSSPANLPQFSWVHAGDDAAGILGYSLSFTAGGPMMPTTTLDIDAVTRYQFTTPVAPGTYWFNIRALDRAGNWSLAFASFGPVVIGPPQPAELEPVTPEFWSDALVCLRDGEGSLGFVPAPVTLDGGVANTEVFFDYVNTGLSTVSHGGWVSGVRFDGVGPWTDAPVPAGLLDTYDSFPTQLAPLFTVPGGRHTVGLYIDRNQELAEASELNNFYSRQFVWTPASLPTGVQFTRDDLGARDGGHEGLTGGYYNAQGYRVPANSGGGWHVVAAAPTQPGRDVDLRLHTTLSTGALDGFELNQAWSARGPGLVEAVFVNRNTVGNVTVDVGALTGPDAPEQTPYFILHQDSDLIPYTGSFDHTFDPALGPVEIREIVFGAGDLGSFSAILTSSDPATEVSMGWLPFTTDYADLHDFTQLVTTDASGRAQLDVNVVAAGSYCLVIYREQSEVAAPRATTPVSISVVTGPTPPNLLDFSNASGWAGPLVPRPAADGTPSLVPEPASLPGDVASTYLNVAVINLGPVGAGGSSTEIRLDGLNLGYLPTPPLASGGDFRFNGPDPVTIPGGRHLLSMRIDHQDVVPESTEEDNRFADQWVWEPTVMPSGATATLPPPPAPSGGFDDIVFRTVEASSPDGGLLTKVVPEVYPNCSGLRLPVPAPVGDDGYWLALATMPGTTKTDPVLRLHEASTGARVGFDAVLASSSELQGESDYVLANFRNEPARHLDVGVVRGGAGISNYTAHSTSSVWLGSSPLGSFGTYVIAPGEILNVHEVYLGEGAWNIELENLDGITDFALALHGKHPAAESESWFGPADTPPGGASVLGLAGEGELIKAVIPVADAGYYAIVVRKRMLDHLGVESKYVLKFSTLVTGVPEAPAAGRATLISGVYPNPFNPRTTIVVDISQREFVTLDVCDVRGRRIRRLLHESRDPGQYEIVFDGLDEQGRPVASGTYFVRARVGHATEVRKVSLVK